jgi:hypothetical protein
VNVANFITAVDIERNEEGANAEKNKQKCHSTYYLP